MGRRFTCFSLGGVILGATVGYFLYDTIADPCPALLAGKVDIECGSTTTNIERLKQAAFFIRRTPTGKRLNLPMNAQLEEVLRVLGLTD